MRGIWFVTTVFTLALAPFDAHAEDRTVEALTGRDVPSKPASVLPAAASSPTIDAPRAAAPDAPVATKIEAHTRDLIDQTSATNARSATGFMVHDDNYFSVGAVGDHKKIVKFQVSVRYELFTLGQVRGYSLSFAYTQKSFWDLFDATDSAQSSPFIENNYRPEGFFSFRPSKHSYSREYSLGFRHESNGLGFLKSPRMSGVDVDQLDASKSWNQIYVSARHNLSPVFALGRLRCRLTGNLRAWYPLWVSAGDLPVGMTGQEAQRTKERADTRMERNLGYVSASLDLRFNSAWIYRDGKLSNESAGLLRVTGKQRSVELSLYVPVYSKGIFKGAIYAQFFHGKAERLLTYDQRTTGFYLGMGLL